MSIELQNMFLFDMMKGGRQFLKANLCTQVDGEEDGGGDEGGDADESVEEEPGIEELRGDVVRLVHGDHQEAARRTDEQQFKVGQIQYKHGSTENSNIA